MSYSGTLTLFSDRPQWNQRPTSYVFSILAHALAIALIAAGFMLTPRFSPRVVTPRYTVRRLDLQLPEPPPIKRPAEAAIRYPTPTPDRPAPKQEDTQPPAPSPAREVAELKPAPQTLMQPKLPRQLLNEKIPVPTVVLWQLEAKSNPNIVPPLPQKAAAIVHPSLQAPNEETNLADIAIASADLASKTQPILSSNTSPVAIQSNAPQAPPQTASASSSQPTPAAIVSFSDLRANGPVVVPDVNETASSNSSGQLAPANPQNQKSDSNSQGQGTAPTHPGQSANQGQGASTASAMSGGPSLSDPTSFARIALPKDGEFGAVVVGSSLEDTYPQVADLWGGRLAYTVYLHVGLRKSWILQYALPASAFAAAGGNAVHLAAPWPYTIIRPNLSGADFNADALMVHGIVNKLGRFESVAVAFPPQFAQAEFVLSALRQWEFRPAAQDGKPIAVEVLLIIPDPGE